MKLDNLSFGKFQEIEPNIMEIVISKNEILDNKKIAQIEDGLLDKYQTPYCLLINRINKYHHTEESLSRIAKLKGAIAFAIVVYNVTEITFAKLHKQYQDNIGIFQEKENALEWLKLKLTSEENKK